MPEAKLVFSKHEEHPAHTQSGGRGFARLGEEKNSKAAWKHSVVTDIFHNRETGFGKDDQARPSALKIIPTSEQPQTTHSNWEILLKKGGILTGKKSILPQLTGKYMLWKKDTHRLEKLPKYLWSDATTGNFNCCNHPWLSDHWSVYSQHRVLARRTKERWEGGGHPVTTVTYAEKLKSREELAGTGRSWGPSSRWAARRTGVRAPGV